MNQNKTRKLSGHFYIYLIFNNNWSTCRIFTVILYMFSVSLGAILLSLYYVFLWKNPHTHNIEKIMVREQKIFKQVVTTLKSSCFWPEMSLETLGPKKLLQAQSPKNNRNIYFKPKVQKITKKYFKPKDLKRN